MARVVVVGAGVSGLATAARLADFGHEVIVYERTDSVGGRVRPRTHDGYTCYADPAPLTLPAVYRDLFRKTGRPLEQVVDLVALDPAVRYRFGDGTSVDLPHASRAGAAAALDSALGPGRGMSWLAALDHGRAVWDAIRSPFLETAPSGRDLLRLAQPRYLRALQPWRSLRSTTRTLVDDTRLRLVLEHPAPGDPRRAPGVFTVVPYLHQTFGRWHVVGGSGALAAALAQRAAERGATVRTGVTVEQVTTTSGSVAGVQLGDGGRVPADVVVVAAGPALLAGLDRPSPASRRPPASAPFTVHLALRGAVPPLPPHTVLFPESTDPAIDDVFGRAPQLPRDPTIEVYAPADPHLRPPGDTAAWTVAVRAPGPHRLDWTADGVAEAYADHVLGVLARRGLSAAPQVAHRTVLTPLDRLRELGSAGSGGWPDGRGLPALRARPRNETGVRGLFQVGSTAYPGPGLALVGLSSLMVADLVGRA